jgi:hypothetical protein
METEIVVPDVIILKSDTAERTIRLENCQNQNEIMEYLKICLSLFAVHYPEKIMENSETTLKILEKASGINKETSDNANRYQSFA